MPSRRTAYVDFNIKVRGVDTSIRIFETETHFFIYVNQHPTEIHLYNDRLKNALIATCNGLEFKEVNVICNLVTHEALRDIVEYIQKIVNK